MKMVQYMMVRGKQEDSMARVNSSSVRKRGIMRENLKMAKDMDMVCTNLM